MHSLLFGEERTQHVAPLLHRGGGSREQLLHVGNLAFKQLHERRESVAVFRRDSCQRVYDFHCFVDVAPDHKGRMAVLIPRTALLRTAGSIHDVSCRKSDRFVEIRQSRRHKQPRPAILRTATTSARHRRRCSANAVKKLR